MKRKHLGLIAAALVSALIFWVILPSEEGKIRKVMGKVRKGIEEEKILAVMGHFSRDYRDEFNNSYESVAGLIAGKFREFEGMKFATFTTEVELIDRETATCRVEARLLATFEGEFGYLLGTTREPASLLVALRKERGEWKIMGASEAYLPK